MSEMLLRFVVGGSAVSAFAVLGDLFTPKRFAGLFAAAPSVAIATLMLTIVADGKNYASIEARSMAVGAIAFFVYAWSASQLMIRHKMRARSATVVSLLAWLVVAFGLWTICLE